jgi:hypothetical protein
LAVSDRPSATSYETPTVVDYGSLVQLTQANATVEMEDGVGKVINQDGSNGLLP